MRRLPGSIPPFDVVPDHVIETAKRLFRKRKDEAGRALGESFDVSRSDDLDQLEEPNQPS